MSRRKGKGTKNKNSSRSKRAKQRQREQNAIKVFTQGPLRVTQSGNFVCLENTMTIKQRDEWQKHLAELYPAVCQEISAHVAACCKLVASTSPAGLLQRLYWHYIASSMDTSVEESQLTHDHLIITRTLEYVQCLIYGVGNENSSDSLDEVKYAKLVKHTSAIHEALAVKYFLARSGYRSQNPGYSIERDAFAVACEMHWLTVRGDRYLIHTVPHLRELLRYQSDDLFRIYGVTSDQIADGVEKLMLSLNMGVGDLMMELKEFQKDTMDAVDEAAPDDHSTPLHDLMHQVVRERGWTERSDSIFGRLHGYDLFDVEKITEWPRSLVESLSLLPGKDSSFADGSDQHAWPTQPSQLRNKPFLQVHQKSFCFGLYTLTDNIYRAIQKSVTNGNPKQAEKWNKSQKRATEESALTIFAKLLPGATILPSVHYEVNEDGQPQLKWAESDGIVIYDRHLFIVEVKAGAYTQKPPGKSIDPHIDSVKKLIREATEQAGRLHSQIDNSEAVDICDSKHSILKTVSKEDFDSIIRCCVTLDQLEHIASHIEDVASIGIEVGQLPLWCVSLNDLRIYGDVFRNPLLFLDFVLERIRAFTSHKCHVYDEMDHLGLYLEHNRYVMRAEKLDFEVQGGWGGYRDELDRYFGSLWDETDGNPPQQKLPLWLAQILNCLSQSSRTTRARMAQFLLSMNGETREVLAKHVEHVRDIQIELQRQRPMSLFGIRLTVVVAQKGFAWSNFDDGKEHTLAVMSLHNEQDRVFLWLQYGDNMVLEDARWAFLTGDDLLSANQEQMKQRVDRLRATRRKLADEDIVRIGRE